MLDHIQNALAECSQALANLRENKQTLSDIEKAALVIISSLKRGGHVFSCGNGGSMCDSMHFAEELSGRFRKDRAPLPATAISDSAHLSCVANDFGWTEVFSRYILSHGKKDDVILAISTSGKSPNVVRAAKQANAMGMKVVALTGKPNSELAEFADIEICTPGGAFSDRVQELHIKVIHILIELVERSAFPQNYL